MKRDEIIVICQKLGIKRTIKGFEVEDVMKFAKHHTNKPSDYFNALNILNSADIPIFEAKKNEITTDYIPGICKVCGKPTGKDWRSKTCSLKCSAENRKALSRNHGKKFRSKEVKRLDT